jgi:hypothetical protein
VEGADEVLALREVDGGLAPDGGVDLAEQRRRDLQDGDAPVPGGGGEPGEVADHAAAEADDEVLAGERRLGARLPQLAEHAGGLGRLAVGDVVAVDGEPGPLAGRR